MPDALNASLATGGPVATLGPDWLDPSTMINSFLDRFGTAAIIGVAVVIFIETGLLFPILPGDSLLFTAGAMVAQGELRINLAVVCIIMFSAAFLGDQTAYAIGRKVGPKLFDRPDGRIYKRKYIDKTHEYFEKYGGRTIVIARFVPIVRTYSAVSAGIARMRYRTFVSYDALGALLWGVGVTVLGYLLGNISFVKENIEVLLVVIVGISVIPMVVEVLRARRNAKKSGAGEVPTPGKMALIDTSDAGPAGGPDLSWTAKSAAAPGAESSPFDPVAPHPRGAQGTPRHVRGGD